MKQAHRQRLVGGIVLLALGVIFVPMVLDFSHDPRTKVMKGEIPEGPDEMKMEILPLEIWSKKIEPGMDLQDKIIEAPSKASSRQTDEPEVVEKPIQPQVAQKSNGKAVEEETVSIPQGASAWVVQIASFNDEPKALALRDELRKEGYTTFVERGTAGKGVLYRVKVGPVLARSEATRMQSEIRKSTRLEGLVMSYR